LRQAFTANSISSSVDIPVAIIIGFIFDAAYSIKGISVISNDAILYMGASSDSRRSTAVLSKGEEKHISPSSLATSNSSLCHSQGVYAFWYSS
jgi:hypothetical protein